MDLNDCFKKGFIKKTRIDKELIFSLIEMSDIKEQTVKTAVINKINISVYLPMAYDSLREVLEAICISKGYKVINHFCIGELLRDIFSNFNYDEFDRFRYIRNGINYYGTKVDFEQGKKIINSIFIMKKELKGETSKFLHGI